MSWEGDRGQPVSGAAGALHTAEKKNMPSANSASIVDVIVGQPRNSSPKEPALVRNGASPSRP